MQKILCSVEQELVPRGKYLQSKNQAKIELGRTL